MKITKDLLILGTGLRTGLFALGVGVATLVGVVGSPTTTYAAVDTCTWTGAQSDGASSSLDFSAATNWTGCDNGNVPEAGDALVFPTDANYGLNGLVNDLGVAFGNVTFQDDLFFLDLDTLTLATGATLQIGFSAPRIDQITTQGDATLVGVLASNLQANWTLGGVLTLGQGTDFNATDVALHSSGVVVQSGAILAFSAGPGSTTVQDVPITLGGGSSTTAPVLRFSNNVYDGSMAVFSLANALTLLGNAEIVLGSNVTVNQIGSITGAGFAITPSEFNWLGSILVLNPSSNTSATIPGTYVGTFDEEPRGAGSSDPAATNAAPGVPDTSTGILLGNPLAIVGLGIASVISLIAAKRVFARR